MSITIKNKEQLDDYRRDIERMEFQIGREQDKIKKLRAAIAEYENSPARIAAKLSRPARIVLEYMCLRSSELSSAGGELSKFGIDGARNTAGLAVLAELQKAKPLGCTHEVVKVDPDGTTENRGFFIDKKTAGFAMLCISEKYPSCIYEVREL